MSVERNAGDVGSLAGSTQVESRPENGVTAQQEPEAARLTAVQPSSESPAIHPATADQASQNESVVSTPRMSAAAVAPSSNGAHVTRSSSSLEPMASSVTPSCSCNGNGNKRLVYALGTLGYDFGTEACRDGFKSLMPYVTGTADGGLIPYIEQEDVEPEMPPYPPNPYDPHQMVNYLAGYPPYGPPYPIQGGFPTLGARFTQPLPEEIAPPPFPPPMPKPPDPYPGYQGYPGYPAHITDAKELIWTLNIELTPVYAIRPHGSYGAEAYQLLVGFLAGQIRSSTDKDWYISRVAIPGVLTGETVRLFSGQVVPVIVPQIRGMASWNVTKLILTSLKTLEIAPDDAARRGPVERQIRGYLNRVYYLLRNLGQAPADRAINYTATNVVQIAGIIAEQLEKEGVNPVLDSIVAQRSPFCRIDSDCWDVSVTFFDADNLLTARDQYLFTVDVREAYPVFVGPYRHFLVPR